MIPKVLKDFNLFVDGVGFAGRVQKVTLPKLSRKMEELLAGGMAGPVELDMGIEKLEMSFDLFEWSENVIRNWGSVAVDGLGLRFMGALERDDDSAQVTPVQVSVRGRLKVIDMGDIEQGKAAPLKAELSLAYYRYTHDGSDLIEIDLPNMIERIGGTDRLAQRRSAIGV